MHCQLRHSEGGSLVEVMHYCFEWHCMCGLGSSMPASFNLGPSQPGLSVPDGSYLHTVAVEVDGAVKYATFAFGQSLLRFPCSLLVHVDS